MLSPALRSAAINRNVQAQAIRDAARRAIIARQQAQAQMEAARRAEAARQAAQQAARQQAARQQAAQQAARQQAARQQAARQQAARQQAARQQAARQQAAQQAARQQAARQQAAQQAARQQAARQQTAARQATAQHAKRVAQGRAIATRVRQVVNYGLGASIKAATQSRVTHTPQIKSSSNTQIKIGNTQSQKLSQTNNKLPSKQNSVAFNLIQQKNNLIKPLTIKQKVANILQKRRELSLQKLSPKEMAKNLIDRKKAAQEKTQKAKESLAKIIKNFKVKKVAAQKAAMQKMTNKRNASTATTPKIATKNVDKQKDPKKNVKQKLISAKSKKQGIITRNNAIIKKAKQIKTNITKKITVTEKQAQSKVGGTTTAILHSYKASCKTTNKEPTIRRSSRIAQQSKECYGDEDGGYRSDGSGSDSDEGRDTNLQPDESTSINDNESRFKWEKNKTEFQYQFRNVNPRFPANKEVMNELKSSEMREMILDDDTDCSEIAERLYKASGGKGSIITIKSKEGIKNIFIGEKQGGGYVPKDYKYHTVFRDNHYVYDPHLSKNPVPRGDYQSIITKLNPQGVKIHEGDLWSAVKVQRRGIFVNKTGKI
ncbi:MAG: hypothetical protein AB7D28_12130 [Candidatus Berkiella sp.]